MQVVAQALGLSQGVLTVWDNQEAIGVALPRPVQVVTEVRWGIGDLGGLPCLVLYIFYGEDVVECYFPEHIATTPEDDVEAWTALFDDKANALKVRYGDHPGDGTREVTLLLPTKETESARDRLLDLAKRLQDAPADDDVHPALKSFFSSILEETVHAPGES